MTRKAIAAKLRAAARTALRVVLRARAAEPDWLGRYRKPVASVLTTGGVWCLSRIGVELTPDKSFVLSIIAGALATAAIPNKPKPGG